MKSSYPFGFGKGGRTGARPFVNASRATRTAPATSAKASRSKRGLRNIAENQVGRTVEGVNAGRPGIWAALAGVVGLRRRHFTPALAAASGSMALRALVAMTRATSSRSLSIPTNAGTAALASFP